MADIEPMVKPSAPSLAQISEDEWIIWAYRLLLGRAAESPEAVRQHRRVPFDPTALRRAFIDSEEFRSALGMPAVAAPAAEAGNPEFQALRAEFSIAPPPPGEPDFFIDYLGVRTRCSYLPPEYAQFSGAVETPTGGHVPLHEEAEMLALLRSVKEAEDQVTVVELGAGWGPWLVAGAAAARRRKLPFRLIGVEASDEHMAFMRTHFADNDIDPGAHNLVLAAASDHDGVVHFPVLPDPALDWGASVDDKRPGEREMKEVPCVSLRTLLRDVDQVDLMHCDVQGAEGDTLTAGIDLLDRTVRRLTIGTHGRAIEEQLHALLSSHGWIIEHDSACGFQQIGGEMTLTVDGTQVWRNARLAAGA